jgi:hypothetical protein
MPEDPMLCPLNSVHTCILYSLPWLTKSNFPYCEKDLQTAVEHTLQDKWKERPPTALLCNVCYCLLCTAINTHTIDLLIICINAFHISALVYHSEVCFILSLEYWIETVKYATKQWMFVCNTAISIMVFRFQLQQRFSNWWTKCVLLGLSQTKNTLDKDVLTEETFDKTGRSENSPHKSLTPLKIMSTTT